MPNRSCLETVEVLPQCASRVKLLKNAKDYLKSQKIKERNAVLQAIVVKIK